MSRTSPVSDADWMAIYRRLAEDGDAEAMYVLSLWLREGRAVRRDPVTADRWLRRAAATLPAAQLEIGVRARGDVDSPPTASQPVARRWLRRAAEAGVPDAWRELGVMELSLPRTPGLVASARRMLEKALRFGDSEAGVRLAGKFKTLGADLDEVEGWLARSVILDDDESFALGLLTAIRVAKPFLSRLATQPLSTWRLLAEAGDLDAQTYLGYAYQYGQGVPREVKAAETWFERSARAGGRDARLALALVVWVHDSSVDFDGAAFWSALAAKDGDPVALFVAGWLDRWCSRPSPRKIAGWWRAAAEKGHPEAAHWLGRCLMFGRGVPKDTAAAVRWLRRAAEFGVPGAQIWYAEILDEGEFVRRDRRAATRWLTLAAQAGSPDAQLKLGVRLHEGTGVRRDDRASTRWYRRAAASGDRFATSNLGLCCRNGHGVRRHEGRASVLFRRAAVVGLNGRAAWQLSWGFDGQAGRPDDREQEVFWLRRGAALMEPEALCSLGVLHHNGKRAPMDRPFAVKLYRAAAKLGNGWAHYLLGLSYRDGEGVSKDRRRARAWFAKAAALGVRKAIPAERVMSAKPA